MGSVSCRIERLRRDEAAGAEVGLGPPAPFRDAGVLEAPRVLAVAVEARMAGLQLAAVKAETVGASHRVSPSTSGMSSSATRSARRGSLALMRTMRNLPASSTVGSTPRSMIDRRPELIP